MLSGKLFRVMYPAIHPLVMHMNFPNFFSAFSSYLSSGHLSSNTAEAARAAASAVDGRTPNVRYDAIRYSEI